jgi:hypothetical protein
MHRVRVSPSELLFVEQTVIKKNAQPLRVLALCHSRAVYTSCRFFLSPLADAALSSSVFTADQMYVSEFP